MKKSPTRKRAVAHQHGGHGTAAAIELGFDDGAHGRTAGVGLEVQHVGHQQDHFEQQGSVLLGARRNRHHDDVAAPIFGQQAAIGKLLLDALGLGVGLVDLVDGHDDRHAGRLGVVDGFERLRHDAVVRRHHQNDDIGDLGAAGTHAGEGFVTGSVDEDDLLAVHLHLVRADVLGDAAGFAAGHIGFANGVEQRSLTVIDVAHDGDHGRAAHLVLRVLGLFHRLHGFDFVAHGGGGGAEIARHFGGQLGVQGLVDGHEDAAVHQLLHHQVGLHVELFGKLLDRDAFGNGDLAVDRRRTRIPRGGAADAGPSLLPRARAAAARPGRWPGRPPRGASTGGGGHTRLHAAARSGMLRARSAGTRRRACRDARPASATMRLAGTDRSAINRLAGNRGGWAPSGTPGRGARGLLRHHRAAGALSLAARSGRGGTTGRAAGCPASGRCGAGRGGRCRTRRAGRGAFRTRLLRRARNHLGTLLRRAGRRRVRTGNGWRGPERTWPGRGGAVGSGLAAGSVGRPGANTAAGGVCGAAAARTRRRGGAEAGGCGAAARQRGAGGGRSGTRTFRTRGRRARPPADGSAVRPAADGSAPCGRGASSAGGFSSFGAGAASAAAGWRAPAASGTAAADGLGGRRLVVRLLVALFVDVGSAESSAFGSWT